MAITAPPEIVMFPPSLSDAPPMPALNKSPTATRTEGAAPDGWTSSIVSDAPASARMPGSPETVPGTAETSRFVPERDIVTALEPQSKGARANVELVMTRSESCTAQSASARMAMSSLQPEISNGPAPESEMTHVSREKAQPSPLPAAASTPLTVMPIGRSCAVVGAPSTIA